MSPVEPLDEEEAPPVDDDEVPELEVEREVPEELVLAEECPEDEAPLVWLL